MAVTENRIPSPDLYRLALSKLGSHQAVVDWFFKPITDDNPVTPQHMLNINADFMVEELLNKLPDLARKPVDEFTSAEQQWLADAYGIKPDEKH